MDARVVDTSHYTTVSNFDLVAKSGIEGIIHKATQGTSYVDTKYAAYRAGTIEAGMLWGAYHFNTGQPVADQVKFFIDHAKPNDKTLMVLDYEDNRPSNMSIHQVVEFLHLLEAAIGRKGTLYSGNRVKETIGQLNAIDKAYLCSHRLWLCQYGPKAVLPQGWSKWWLWQFTGDGIGPTPHSVPGIEGNKLDINTFVGTRDELAASWSGSPLSISGSNAMHNELDVG
jgi:lysozyme